jgi:ribosomal protein L7/L12
LSTELLLRVIDWSDISGRRWDMSFIVETDGVTWEVPDNLKDVVVNFFEALRAANSDIKVFPSSMGEIVVPRIMSIGPRRIHLIKEIRAAYGLALKEAKEKQEEPTPIRMGPLPMHQAIAFQKACQEAGAVVELPNALDRLAKI